ncbi:MAG: hypothetical protein WC592_04110 [Candidatus Omnitrophota bacterium]|nr:hypothetical protein [Candidatus Omnitrophota bacterium]
MKRIAIMAMAVLFASSVTLAFAEQPQKEQNLFKIIQGTIKFPPAKEKNRVKIPPIKVSMFQDMATRIEEGSAKARTQSLRTAKTK